MRWIIFDGHWRQQEPERSYFIGYNKDLLHGHGKRNIITVKLPGFGYYYMLTPWLFYTSLLKNAEKTKQLLKRGAF